jgi:hypothetical protein
MKLKAIFLLIFLTISLAGQNKYKIEMPSVEPQISGYPFSSTSFDSMRYMFLENGIIKMQPVQITPEQLILFFVHDRQPNTHGDPDAILGFKSFDGGLTWTQPFTAHEETATSSHLQFAAAVTPTGRIILVYNRAMLSERFYIKYSDDAGATWSEPQIFGGGIGNSGLKPNLSVSDSAIWFFYDTSTKNIFYRKSTDNGITWTAQAPLVNTGDEESTASLVQLDAQKIGVTYQRKNSSGHQIYLITSTDNGTTWASPQPLTSTEINAANPKILKNNSNKIWVIFESHQSISTDLLYRSLGDINLSCIKYITSSDFGNSWSETGDFTKFAGYNGNASSTIEFESQSPLVFFSSNRFRYPHYNYSSWYGKIGITNDIAPPFAASFYHSPVALNETIKLLGYADDVSAVSAEIFVNDTVQNTITLYDDGNHNDLDANDNFYGNEIGAFNVRDTVKYYLKFSNENYDLEYFGGSYMLPYSIVQSAFIDVNRFKLGLTNNGILADLRNNQAVFDGGIVLFSGGFALSGKTGETVWANGVMTSSRIMDYQPGNVGSDQDAPQFGIYQVKISDPPFGEAWLNWNHAVNSGRRFL